VWRIVFRCHRTGDEYIVVLTIQLEFEIRIRHGFLTQRVLRVPRILFPFLFKEERNARPSRRATTSCGLASSGSRTTTSTATTAPAAATGSTCGWRLLRKHARCDQQANHDHCQNRYASTLHKPSIV
jgi:hypothetical protein